MSDKTDYIELILKEHMEADPERHFFFLKHYID